MEEAIGLVIQRLKKLRQEGEPQRLMVIGGRYRGHMADLMSRFLDAYGSPIILGIRQGIPKAFEKAISSPWNQRISCGPLEEVNYVLSFEESLLEASRPLLRNLWGYGFLRRGRPGIRGKLVQIEPRFSVTASKADQWIPILPGTHGALALGIAHWIIREKRYDHDFIQHHNIRFDDWKDSAGKTRMGFKSLVLKTIHPNRSLLSQASLKKPLSKWLKSFPPTDPRSPSQEEGWYADQWNL